MAEAVPQPLCTSAALAERGRAQGFDLLLWGRPARGFALRIDGRVVAYVNQCAHVAAEMDWQEGEFLDRERRYIVCAIHGATYEPASGRCVAGPCVGARLRAIEVTEHDGEVSWYPSPDIRPPVSGDDHAAAPRNRSEPPP
jgi:nitrite reductase/ring-hydroxylating ferredoxin subunit